MYTISRLAELCGLSPSTVRAWERRYTLLAPRRSESGYRLYADADVQVLRAMARLVGQGWSPSEAAAHLRGRGAGSDLVEAVRAGDTARALHLWDEHFAITSFEAALDGWLMPALIDIGNDWIHGGVDIAGEHVVVSALQRRLSVAFEAAGVNPEGPADVITGLPAHSVHELGILAFATCLRRLGVQVVHLGCDLPAESWEVAALRHRPSWAILSAPMDTDVETVQDTARRLIALGVEVGVGGACQQDAAKGVDGLEALGHSIPAAAADLAGRVRAMIAS